jgi:pimeloyl-ACP methyl ester carboxylesterase
MDPEPVTVERDGLTIAALDWGFGGEGPAAAAPVLVLLHPNGFCAGLFHPLALRLRDSFRPVGVDLRGQGGTDAPSTVDGFAYEAMAKDVVAVLDHLGVDEVVGLGESLGGGVAIVVDVLQPGRVRKVMLCEAIAFGFDELPRVEPGSGAGDGGNYMSAIARKRRAVWPDRETARASYASRPPLDALAPEALDAYVWWGFHDRPDGQVELACDPEVEATLFESTGLDQGAPTAWRHLADLTADAVVLRGTGSDLPGDWFAAQAQRSGAPLLPIPGGHFFLQEDTDRAEGLVREHLGSSD